MKIILQNRKIVLDMLLNIIAVSVPVAILQLVVYPITAQKIGGEEYGLMLTIYSVWMMISNSLGNVFNNIRLLYSDKYDQKGDFNILILSWELVNAIIIGIVILLYCNSFDIIHVGLGVIVAILIMAKSYLEVGFRINLNYKSIVINNLLQSVGFIVGILFTLITGIWESIFICGYLFSCVYCTIKTKLLFEPLKKTRQFKELNSASNKLIIATIIGNLMTYADKLVLYPLMGGYTVSIYYTASILGKIVGMITGPINSVILSYIRKWKSNNKQLIAKILLIGVFLCSVGYLVTIVFYKPVLNILFPQWVNDVMRYIPLTTINVMLMVLTSIISPFVLKFCDMKWQVIINIVGGATYFLGALVLWKYLGLTGFCIGVIIGTLTKLLIMLLVYFRNSKIEYNKAK